MPVKIGLSYCKHPRPHRPARAADEWVRSTPTAGRAPGAGSRAVAQLNQGTCTALVPLEQKGWIKGAWQTTETNREAKYYAITKSGARALEKQTERWRRLSGLVEKLLLGEG